MQVQTNTSFDLMERPAKARLLERFVGKDLEELRTPALIIDRTTFAENCARMHRRSKAWGASFRAHLKSHKTVEGTRLQLKSDADRTNAVVVSTVMEAWELVRAGLLADSTVKDILYGMPVSLNRVKDLSALREEVLKQGGILRVIVDHPDQVKFLEQFERDHSDPRLWSVFVKVDGGLKRAGVQPGSSCLDDLLSVLFASPCISVYGFYTHAGHSYASRSFADASVFLTSEIDALNASAAAALVALKRALRKEVHEQPFVLSAGSTPTVQAVNEETRQLISKSLNGRLELHAGNYPLLDLQQMSTGMVDDEWIAQKILATVVSYYPGRGEGGTDEALIDAGAIALSKDVGPSGNYGIILGTGWRLEKISQEHGVLIRAAGYEDDQKLELGKVVEIVGQHACLICAGHPWYYIVDGDVERGKTVVDIWVPWKGW